MAIGEEVDDDRGNDDANRKYDVTNDMNVGGLYIDIIEELPPCLFF